MKPVLVQILFCQTIPWRSNHLKKNKNNQAWLCHLNTEGSLMETVPNEAGSNCPAGNTRHSIALRYMPFYARPAASEGYRSSPDQLSLETIGPVQSRCLRRPTVQSMQDLLLFWTNTTSPRRAKHSPPTNCVIEQLALLLPRPTMSSDNEGLIYCLLWRAMGRHCLESR